MIESGSRETIEAIFDRAIEIEYKAANIYTGFSQLFSHMPEIMAFWKGMAEDEKRQMAELQEIRKSLTNEQLLLPCDKKITEKVAEINRLLSNEVNVSIKNLDDAYELSNELEFSEVNAIFKFLSAEFVPSGRRIQLVASELKHHQNKLMEFFNNFGDRNWRKGISIRPV